MTYEVRMLEASGLAWALERQEGHTVRWCSIGRRWAFRGSPGTYPLIPAEATSLTVDEAKFLEWWEVCNVA